MKNREVLERYYAFYDESDVPLPLKIKGLKIMYAVSKNRDTIQSAAKHLKMDVIAPASEQFKEYEKQVQQLYIKHSDDGKKTIQVKTPLGIKHQYDVSGNIKAFEKDLNALVKKNEGVLEERKKQVDEYNEFLEKDHKDFVWETFTLAEVDKYNPDPDEVTFNALKTMIDGNKEGQEKTD